MNEAFDPYYKWLGIPPKDQPPNHYRLLGLDLFEPDPDVIDGAAEQRMAFLRSVQAGAHSAESQQILNQVAAAKLCLLDAMRKAAYDDRLREPTEANPAEPEIPFATSARPSRARSLLGEKFGAKLTAIVVGSMAAVVLARGVVYVTQKQKPVEQVENPAPTEGTAANPPPITIVVRPHLVATTPNSVEQPASSPEPAVVAASSPAADASVAKQPYTSEPPAAVVSAERPTPTQGPTIIPAPTPTPTLSPSPTPIAVADPAPASAILASPTVLAHSAAIDDSNAPLAAAALAVFTEDCYRCHGRDGSNEGGLNFILQSDKLIAKRYIVPGDASASRLFKRVVAGTMPPEDEQPRPSAEQTTILKRWLEAGAPLLTAPPAPRPWLSNSDIVKAINDDVQRQNSENREFLRYFTLTHLYNAGLSDDELHTYRLGLSKLINSLSWGEKIVVPQPIDSAQTILRIDLRDFKWTEKTWDSILQQNPYSLVTDTSQFRDLIRSTRSELPFVRGDWFVAAASVPPLYHQVLELPETSDDLERLLRISVADDIHQLRVARAGFNQSGISRNNRLIERHSTYFGAYWQSYDFGHSEDRGNLFSHPLGPNSGANSFRPDASEIIFNLPNGLQAYMLVDGAGDRQDKAPLNIVSDPRRPDRAVVNGLSCISCHIGGIHEKADEVREAVHANLKSFPLEEARAVAAIYPPRDEMRKLQVKDAERFQAALKLTGTLPSRTEPVLMLVQRFEFPLDLTLTAAELGIQPGKFLKLLDSAPQSSRTFAALRSPGGTIQRQVLVDGLDTLVSELKLSRASTFAGGSTTPPAVAIVRAPETAPDRGKTKPDKEVARIDEPRGSQDASSNDLKAIFTFKLAAVIPDLILAKDRDWLYFLNASDGEIRRLDTQTMKLDDTIVDTGPGAQRMQITPDGKTLYAITAPDGHPTNGNRGSGKIIVIPAQQFKATRRFSVPFDPLDLAPDNKGRIAITTGGQIPTWMELVDANKQATIAQPTQLWEPGTVQLSRDEKILALGNDHGINLFATAAFLSKLEPGRSLDWFAGVGGGAKPRAAFSPDGKFLLSPQGVVARVTVSNDRSLPTVATIDRWDAIAFDPASSRLLIATEDKQLKLFSFPAFELVRAFNVGVRIRAMALDAVGGKLYAATTLTLQGGRQETSAANLQVFDVGALVGKLQTASTNEPGKAADAANSLATVEADAGLPRASSKSTKEVPRIEGRQSKEDAAGNDLKPIVTFKLAAVVPDLILAKDHDWLYFLNSSEGEIRRLDTQTTKLDDTIIDTGPGAQRLAMSHDGKTMYAITAPDGHSNQGNSLTGKVLVIPSQQFKATKRFSIPFDPLELAPDNKGRIYIMQGGRFPSWLQVVDASKQAVIAKPTEFWDRGEMELSRDEKLLFVGHGRGAQYWTVTDLFAKNATPGRAVASTAVFEDSSGRQSPGGRFGLSPDGKFLATANGRVGRVGNNRIRDIPEVAKLDRWDAIAFDSAASRVFISTEDKQLKLFSLPDFELVRAFNIGSRVNAMALDAAGGKLYAMVAIKLERGQQATVASDLAVFDVADQLGKLNTRPASEPVKPADADKPDNVRAAAASQELIRAQRLLRSGNRKDGIDLLRKVIADFPDTKAAEKAQTLLK